MNKVKVIQAALTPRLRLCLTACEYIAPGEVVISCAAHEITSERTWRTVQVDYKRHVKNEFLDYVEHSCEPNAVFVAEDLKLVALKPIPVGERITFFYPGTEVELAQDFECHCGSPECLGHLKGGFYLTPRQMRWALDRGYCSSFMRQNLARLLKCADPG